MTKAQLKTVSNDIEAPAHEHADSPVGTTMTFALGSGQQMEFQVVYPAALSLPELNDQLDKLRAAGVRQRWIAQRDENRNNLVLQERERATGVYRMDVAKAEFEHFSAKRKARVDAANIKIGEINTAERAAFTATEKRGEYQPSRKAAQEIATLQNAIRHELEEQARAEDEQEQALKGHHDALRSIKVQESWFASEIERLTGLIGDGG